MSFDFGAIAAEYDEYYIDPVGNLIDRLEKNAVDRVLGYANPGQKLIDVGAGTGHWSVYFASKGYEVTGVELEPEMVAIARSKRIVGARFVRGHAEELPFGNGSFDVGAAITLLEFVKDPALVIGELSRVVMKGGKLIIGVLHSNSALGVMREQNFHPVYSSANFFSEDQLVEYLSPHGEVNIVHCLFRFPAPDTIEKTRAEEKEGLKKDRRDGCFIVAEVSK
jgi:ubiquinone/menaquinone biosynthesis C-methylase UbiE